ncbi:MAG: hypothetical protein ACK5Q5_05295 [Planctomycetaceae bacterium]
MKALPLLLCLSVLGLSAAGLWPAAAPNAATTSPANPQFLTGNATAETRWAAGLLHAVQQSHGEKGLSVDRGTLLDALDAADSRAPVYVSIALHQPGQWEAFPSLDQLRRELDRRAGVLSPRLKEVATRAAPRDRLTKHLLTTLQPALEEFRTTADVDNPSGQLADLFIRSGSCARLCLEAAVVDDPTCVAAWAALAMQGDGGQRLAAIEQWQSLDPENAVPRYVAALAHQTRGDTAAALTAIRSGNACLACRFPAEMTPRLFDVSLTESPDTTGPADQQRLTPVGLSNLLQLDEAGKSGPNPAADLHRVALMLAESVVPSADPEHAATVAAALQRLGTQLMTAAPTSATQVRHGVAILQLGAGLEGDVDSQSALTGYDFHLQRTTRELSAGLSRWNERASELLGDREAILHGHVDLRKEEQSAMHKLLTAPLLQPVLAARSEQHARVR